MTCYMQLTKRQKDNIEILKREAKEYFSEDFSGHDYLHSLRVLENAVALQLHEGGDLYLISLAAILHDFDDAKLSPENDGSMLNTIRMLKLIGEDEATIEAVRNIIESVSFSKGKEANGIEAKIVQDADRLDAIGAIGIARCFAYGGNHERPIYYDNDFLADRKKDSDSSIGHFYHKLLRIEDKMQTKTGKALAERRTEFLKCFLSEFLSELNNNEDKKSIFN